MTALNIANLQIVISTILMVISILSFMFIYNKAIRNRVDKTDLCKLEDELNQKNNELKDKLNKKNDEMKDYVDQQDRAIHHRITEYSEQSKDSFKEVNKKLNIIINKLLQ